MESASVSSFRMESFLKKGFVCLVYAFKLKKFMLGTIIQLDCKSVKDTDTIVKTLYQCVLYYVLINLQ